MVLVLVARIQGAHYQQWERYWTEVYEVLTSLGYEISDKNKLVGEAKGEKVKDAIYDFYDDRRNNLDDTLVFYYLVMEYLMLTGRCTCIV
jgi:hypothetical protein